MVSATHQPDLGDIGPFAIAVAGQYRIERELGSGGMATVYLAIDLKHQRRVAIKVLHPKLGAWLGAERFLTEIRITARLQHPHILPLLDSGEASAGPPGRREGPSFLYYVMPYVEGETLRARLRREQQLPVTEAVRIAKELAAALSYAHAHGVIHRDIKPENVLLAEPNAGSPAPALLADFGIARALDSPGDRLTGTGVTVGTAAYMSPEQATGEREIDGRSDVYSLGCVLYEMLAGEPPFTGPNPRAILAKSLADPVRPVGRIRDGIPPSIEAALATALGRTPADRFPDMSAFGAALEAPSSVGLERSAATLEAPEVTRGRSKSLVAAGRRLDSWKEVAAYLGRGVRTVQRWERDEGLPVHRLAHAKRGSIYAYSHEVDAWWERRRVTLSAEKSDDEVAATPSTPRLDRLTWISAATFWPALSSDGRLLAYVSDGGREGTSPQIWLQQIGGSALCLTMGTRERSFLSFSADDTRLVFTATDDSGQNVYTMPALGGEPKLLKRAARAGRPSPDGKWLAYLSLDEPAGVRIAAMDGTTDRTIAPSLIDVSFAIWSPDSKYVLVQAHSDPTMESDYWIACIDGSVVESTGILQRLRAQGLMPLTFPAAWVSDSLVFTLITPTGVTLWRQRLSPATLRATGEPERLTRGTEFDCFVTGASGRLAFVSTHPDQNLWSVVIDPVSGMAHGSLRRLTRGPGFVAQLSVSQDVSPTLAYFCARPGSVGLKLRALTSGAETDFAPEPPLDYGFPAISPSGRQLAYGARSQGARAMRPIFIATLPDGPYRKLGDDCGGRPRQWIDERLVVLERLGARLHSVALLDTVSGDQRDILSSPEQSITNARVSPDGEWIAFDAARPGGPPTVFAARLRMHESIQQVDWLVVDKSASHPFWSADGSVLYYLPTTPSSELRNVVRARRFDPSSVALGEPFTAFTSAEMVVPANITGIAPVATRAEIIFVLGDFRGDVWMMEL